LITCIHDAKVKCVRQLWGKDGKVFKNFKKKMVFLNLFFQQCLIDIVDGPK